MSRNFSQLYVHCVWATWDRLPIVTPDIKDIVYAANARQCQQLNCTVIAIGGVADHVHLLTSFPPKVRGRAGNHFPTLPFGTGLTIFTASGYWVIGPCPG